MLPRRLLISLLAGQYYLSAYERLAINTLIQTGVRTGYYSRLNLNLRRNLQL
jgi:hypothetical protein